MPEKSSKSKLTGIAATGVLNEFDYHLLFREGESGRMRIIYAPNGRGKTNLLKGVNLLLNPSVDSLEALTEVPIQSLEISFVDGHILKFSKKDAFSSGYSISFHEGGEQDCAVDISVDANDFSGTLHRRAWEEREDFRKLKFRVTQVTSDAIMIGDDRLSFQPEASSDIRRSEVRTSLHRRREAGTLSQLLERVELMMSKAAFAGLSRESSKVGVYADITTVTLKGEDDLGTTEARTAIESSISEILESAELYEKYGLISFREIRGIAEQLKMARQNSRYLPTLHRILMPYLENLKDRIESLESALNLIDTFVTGVNKFLERKEMRFSTTEGVTLIGAGGIRIQPDSLSSGEKHLLHLLSQAILATPSNSLMVIDEPELSLGIEWQRLLIPELLNCTRQAETQFLVASHSLQVMNAVPRDEIVLSGDSK